MQTQTSDNAKTNAASEDCGLDICLGEMMRSGMGGEGGGARRRQQTGGWVSGGVEWAVAHPADSGQGKNTDME